MAIFSSIVHIPNAAVVLPAACLLVFVIAKLITQYFSPQARRLRSLKVISEKDDVKLRKAIGDAFNQYSRAGEFYIIDQAYHQLVVIPPKFVTEVKALPESQLSFSEEIYERYNGEVTSVGRFEPSFIKTITGDLTKQIPRMLSELVEETDYAFTNLIGESSGPVSLTVLPVASRLIALMSGRLFVGLPLCRDENWLHAMIVHTNNTFSVSEKVWKYPYRLRPYIAPYIKEFQRMSANRTKVEHMLSPLVAARQKAAFSEDTGEFHDILQRLIQNAPADKKADVAYHARNQLEMSVAGIHTTSRVLTQAIFNLAAYPDFIPELREELCDVFHKRDAESRSLVMSKPRLAKAIKLDSFLKETQRMDPLAVTNFNRKIMSPNGITFSNGLHLPYGTFTGLNSYHIMQDPTLYPHPEKFDAFRFSKLHAQGGINTTKWQFTTVNPEFPAFGQGTHSCPGRFFAAIEIKVVLVYILLNYDVAFESGQTRPANKTRGVKQNPNPQTKVVFTPREDAWSLAGEYE